MSQIPESSDALRSLRTLPLLPLQAGLGFVAAIIAVVLIAWVSYDALAERTTASARTQAAARVLDELGQLLSTLKDAETGQRGFLLTGEVPYLDPFLQAKSAVGPQLALLRELVKADAPQQRRADQIAELVNAKLAELEQSVALRQSGDTAAALAMVRSDRGRALMDQIRELITTMEQSEQLTRNQREQEWRTASDRTVYVTLGGALLLFVLILLAAFMTSRQYRLREAEAWLRSAQAGFSRRLWGEQGLQSLGENALGFLTRQLEAPIGVVYVAPGGGRHVPVATYAVSKDPGAEIVAGHGLVGQAIKDAQLLHVRDLPPGYLALDSGSGHGAVRELVILPAKVDGVVHGAIELGFLHRVQETELELLRRAGEAFAVALRTAKDRTRVLELLEETQQQAEELQTQQEELRVSNEELEEQSNALRASRTQLENQQAELEQSNAQLEEQAQQLERQRDELAQSQVVLIDKAAELERSNSYKSEFLANMSHELRTPLNSTLILAKLLEDNKGGNLTDEQVKFAQTISSAGRDLLAIINDVLDLAKIEAGRVEVSREKINVVAATDTLVRSLRPLAQEKGLRLTCAIEPGVPAEIQSDPLRLGQILRNLLSNALKFTERGEVALRVSASGETITFAVHDTGIGIAQAQQEVIFEAFRQADGSMHRKYGGTGLGLSISRDLARLLGGDIMLRSAPGQGSIFTLILPLQAAAVAMGRPDTASGTPTLRRAVRELPAAAVADESTAPVDGKGRRVLVIEDDVAFAEILRDVAQEMGFTCVVAHTGGDGLASAALHQPSAILLDINLPDQSGLGVLDQLKRDPRTRHVPVHVISVADYAQQALERGAFGYAVKPVLRAQLMDALRQMEAKSASRIRSVLVVEDNAVQLESVRRLLLADDVTIVGVESAQRALAALQSSTFDCMVLDLNLPDMSGIDLLQQMAANEDVAFPPVIVYTGRVLSRDEEQALGRFSKSIIIKDARSPERLLDEVTLFLHQMESDLPPDQQRMLKAARDRDTVLEGRRILVVEDDVRNIFAVSSVLEPCGARIEIARNGREALDVLERAGQSPEQSIDLVLMDIMMPEMDGFTAMRLIREKPHWRKLPIIALTAKAMKDDHEKCLAAGASDYIAKPLDVDKLLSLVRVWMPR